MRYLVFDIGGTFTKYALMDENAHMQKKGKVPTRQDDQEQFVGMLVDLFEKESPVDGIAISTAGFVEPESGIMHNAGSILCVHELPIVKELKGRCHVPVSVENDAKAAALAELWKGSLADWPERRGPDIRHGSRWGCHLQSQSGAGLPSYGGRIQLYADQCKRGGGQRSRRLREAVACLR